MADIAKNGVGDYDVYISHCGADIRGDFALFLKEELESVGVRCFLADLDLRIGDDAAAKMLQAMETASYGIVILTPKFFEREWCMKELQTFVQRGKLLPVFFGQFQEILAAQQAATKKRVWESFTRFVQTEHEYINAANASTLITGVRMAEAGWWSSTIRRVRDEMLRLLGKVKGGARIAGDDLVVGLHEHLPRLKGLLGVSREASDAASAQEVGIIGVKGMAGIGKSTLAKQLYNDQDVREWFTGGLCWLEVGPKPTDAKVCYLQRQILRTLLALDEDPVNPTRGRALIRELLKGKRVLICLDDVWENSATASQVVKLGDLDPGSRILITSRVRKATAGTVYDLDVLEPGAAWELFCWHAFGGLKVPSDVVGPAQQAVAACGGVPLALTLLGRQVAPSKDKGRCLQDFLAGPKDDISMGASIRSFIRTSYESLPPELGDVFVLIAGLWHRGGQHLDLQRTAEDLGAALYGQKPLGVREMLARAALEKLADMSLIKLERTEENQLVAVHDLIAEFAEIVADEGPPSGRRFYYRPEATGTVGVQAKDAKWEHVRSSLAPTSSKCLTTSGSRVLSLIAEKSLEVSPSSDEVSSRCRLLIVRGGQMPALHLMGRLQCLRLSGCKSRTLPGAISSLTDLNILEITDCAVSGLLPPDWAALTGLRTISLGMNRLSGSLPPEWAALTGLRMLDLHANRLSGVLPREWAALTALEKLDLRANELRGALPSEWAALTTINALDLSNNKLTGTLPSEWAALTALETLDLHANELNGSVPAEWAALTAVKLLDLRNNKLSGPLPAEWKHLTSGALLSDLAGGDLSSPEAPPPTISRLPPSLQEAANRLIAAASSSEGHADLSGLSLGHLPLDDFEALPALVEGIRSLNLSNTGLIDEGSYKGPEPLAWTSYQGLTALAKLSNLHTLILAGNHLTSLPAELGQLTRLRHLDMRRNQLQALPESVSNMTALVRLLLDGNVGLIVVPDWLSASCPKIEELSLEACGFSAFPFPVLRVPLLRKLRLGRNSPGMTLPSSLVDAQSGHLFIGGLEELSLASLALVDENLFCLEPLKQLKTVDLRENKLVSVPHFLFEVDGLQSLELRGNNGLVTPPREIVQHGLPIMREYMRVLAAGKPVRRTIVRVMFVGYAEAGKTKLNYALQGRMAEWKLGSTVGIDTAKWAVDWAGPDSELYEFRSWDFAGQKDYYAMHRIFLTDRAIYLFLVDLSTPQPGEGDFAQVLQQTVRFWLDSIMRRTNKAFVRVVATKVDRLEAGVVMARLQVLLDLLREEQRFQSARLAEKRQDVTAVELGEGLLLPTSIDDILLSSLPQDPVVDDVASSDLGHSEAIEKPEALQFSGTWGPRDSAGAVGPSVGRTGKQTKQLRVLPEEASAELGGIAEGSGSQARGQIGGAEAALASSEGYLGRIRSELLKLAKKECFQIELPASYVQLMAAVEKKKFGAEAVPYMDWNAFRDEMLSPAGLVTDKSAEVATTLLHELGIVLWFKPRPDPDGAHEPAGLAQRVFLDPQWVIDLLKPILSHKDDKELLPPSEDPEAWGAFWACEYASDPEGAQAHRFRLMKLLKEKGNLHHELLDFIPNAQQAPTPAGTFSTLVQQDVLDLLERYRLAYPVKPYPDGYHFVPSRCKERPPSNLYPDLFPASSEFGIVELTGMRLTFLPVTVGRLPQLPEGFAESVIVSLHSLVMGIFRRRENSAPGIVNQWEHGSLFNRRSRGLQIAILVDVPTASPNMLEVLCSLKPVAQGQDAEYDDGVRFMVHEYFTSFCSIGVPNIVTDLSPELQPKVEVLVESSEKATSDIRFPGFQWAESDFSLKPRLQVSGPDAEGSSQSALQDDEAADALPAGHISPLPLVEPASDNDPASHAHPGTPELIPPVVQRRPTSPPLGAELDVTAEAYESLLRSWLGYHGAEFHPHSDQSTPFLTSLEEAESWADAMDRNAMFASSPEAPAITPIVLYERPQVPRQATFRPQLTLESNLEEGMLCMAYYTSEDDAPALLRRLQAELAVCLPAKHYVLDYATFASTVIYVQIIKTTSKTRLDEFLRALKTVSESAPPRMIVEYSCSETQHRDVFEIREEGGMLRLLRITPCPIVDRIVYVSFQHASSSGEGLIQYLVMHGFHLFQTGFELKYRLGDGGKLKTLSPVHTDTLGRQRVLCLIEEPESVVTLVPPVCGSPERPLYIECWRGAQPIGNQILIDLSDFRIPSGAGPEARRGRAGTMEQVSLQAKTAAISSPMSTSDRPEQGQAGQAVEESAVPRPRPMELQPGVKARDHWDYDIFISHAGPKKHLARDLEDELKHLGFKSFVDVNGLRPGDKADAKMRESAERAPIGLVLFNRDFLNRVWPMKELKIIIEVDTLLPVIVDMSHTEFEAAWRASDIASQLDEEFFNKVRRTTCIVHEGGWEGNLRQRACLAVTRVFIEEVCSGLPDTRESANHIRRALEAAEQLKRPDRYRDLSKRDLEDVETWIRKLKSMSGI